MREAMKHERRQRGFLARSSVEARAKTGRLGLARWAKYETRAHRATGFERRVRRRTLHSQADPGSHTPGLKTRAPYISGPALECPYEFSRCSIVARRRRGRAAGGECLGG